MFAAVLLFVAQHAVAQNAPPKLTSAQWQADVRFLGDELPKRHKNAYHRMRREDFEAAVNTLYAAVPKMTDDDIVIGLMKLVEVLKLNTEFYLNSANAYDSLGDAFAAAGKSDAPSKLTKRPFRSIPNFKVRSTLSSD